MARLRSTTGLTSGGSLVGGIEYDDFGSDWKMYQDERPFLEQAKRDREQQKKRDIGYKKFATIPDIVAIEVKNKHGIDIHNNDHASDKPTMDKFKKIIRQDYAYLLSF